MTKPESVMEKYKDIFLISILGVTCQLAPAKQPMFAVWLVLVGK